MEYFNHFDGTVHLLRVLDMVIYSTPLPVLLPLIGCLRPPQAFAAPAYQAPLAPSSVHYDMCERNVQSVTL